MQSIVKFSFPDLVYRCVLNRFGRRRYGTLEQLLQTNTGVPSTVGLPDGKNVPMPEFRNSTKFSTIVEFSLDSQVIMQHLEALLEEDDVLPHWPESYKYDVIQYGVGGFFKEHQDKRLKPSHYGTLLVFPPAVGPFAHTGGDLILDKGKFRFSSSKNKEWTFIGFHTNIPHECKEVLSGNRIVLKTELYSSRPLANLIEPYLGLVDGNLPQLQFMRTD
jgi:hypothetical protein